MTWSSPAKCIPPYCLLVLMLFVPGSPASTSDAFGLLDSTIRAYEELASYRDHGSFVSIVYGSSGPVAEYFEFEIRADAGRGFLLRFRKIDPEGGEQVTWIEDGEPWIWETGSGLPRTSATVASALASSLGVQAIDALLVPLLLAGDTELIATPEAAVIDGREACGASSCDILAVSRRDGRSLSRLWIDRQTGLIRRVEVDHLPPSGSRSGALVPQHTLRLDHDIEALNAQLALDELVFVPPPAIANEPQSSSSPETASKASDFVVTDEISVTLRTLPVRALDARGRPLRGLTADDFEVRLGKQEIQVLSVDWISAHGERLETLSAPSMAPPTPMSPRDEADGNLIVFFIQSDFNSVRVKGHLRVLPFVREFLGALEEEDWVAAVSFDSHLKFWHDLSRDRDSVGDAIERAVRFGSMPPILPAHGRSLARTFPAAEAKRAATPEDALRLTARSLIDIPGEKILVYLGWGLGRYGSSGFRMTQDYYRALATLDAARTSVFVLDVTDADYHTLELGIRQVAHDTGGTYAKTNTFGRRQVLQLTESISGYYLLTLDRDSLPEERRRLRINLRDHQGEVLLREHHLSR